MTILTVLLGLALAGSLLYILYVVRHTSTVRLKDKAEISDLMTRNSVANEKCLSLENRLLEEKQNVRDLNVRLETVHADMLKAISEKERLSERIEIERREQSRLAEESERRFKLLAAEILEVNSGKFNENSRRCLAEMLSPLKDDIDRFKQQVENAYNSEARERFALSERIKELVELNQTIGREAKDLTRALRGDSKVQGDWGEMVLETLLEKSGLVKGVHFNLQLTTDASGNTLRDASGHLLRPDAVINYPDGRCVVIDSKVSLTNYIDYINHDSCTPEADSALQSHLRSVRAHISELAAKNYQDFIGDKKADFVIMFIPNEGGYLAAMQADSKLWQEAYDKRVLVVSPTHLLSVIKLVEQMWRQDDMKRNVIEIASESGKMYDKFVGFLDDMARVEKALGQADTAFSEAMNKLSVGKGNLVRRAELLRGMGAKATKRISSTFTDRALLDSEAD